GYFRDIMAAAVGCPADAFLHVSAAELSIVQNAAGQLGLETILAILQILDQTISRLKYLMQPRTVAELALVRICRLEDLDSLPQLISSLRDGSASQTAADSAAPGAPSKRKFDPPAATPQSTNGNGHLGIVTSIASPIGNGHEQIASPAQIEEPLIPGVADAATLDASSPQSGALLENPLILWQQAAGQLGGLAAEKAQQATAARVSSGDQLVIVF